MAIVVNTNMDIGVRESIQISVFIFLDIYTKVGLLDHIIVLFLVFGGISMLFAIVAAPIYIPASSVQGSLFHAILANSCLWSCDDSHSKRS